MRKIHLSLIILLFALNVCAQDSLYSNTFPLSKVTLLDGPLKHAQDLNIEVLLKYNTDRLLAPYLKVAGITPKAENYGNWESDGLDGHICGHYLSAMAMNYASTGNEECLQRMRYMLSELKDCQDANAKKYPSWGVGYVGGVPNSNDCFSRIKNGDIGVVWNYWVPWYNVHKMFAGLRDAWMYTGNDTAKTMLIKFCDWAVNLTSGLSENQMGQMLGNEHGGMNEVLADAYQITGEDKYLIAAKRFSHKEILNPLSSGTDNLDNLHANTQVPKVVGFQRIAELDGDTTYIHAASFFWETVVNNRTLAIGGNSREEHFPSAASCEEYITSVQGPESCNTNNMLKLTADLFRVNPDTKYSDFYERALFNHILSTQHPEHGGYVYFTPARPRHYRVYSAPELAMWCCVGTGMENHGKYGEFIYTHQNDSLYINLFVASELDWSEKGVKIRQNTNFPYTENSTIHIIEGSGTFPIMVRYPSWVNDGGLEIKINGISQSITAPTSSYVALVNSWETGDSISIYFPMHTKYERLPNVPNYIAFLHGPIVLGAKTGTQDITGLIADDGRWAHIAGGTQLPLDEAPIFITQNMDSILADIKVLNNDSSRFILENTNMLNADNNLTLEPFFGIHDSRYMLYWMRLSEEEYQSKLDSMAALEAEKLALEERTLDYVQPGQQQPESDHYIKSNNSYTGTHLNEFWRDARNGGYFSYQLSTKNKTNLSLMVKYWGNEGGSRTFYIYIDDTKLVTENITGKWNKSEFVDVEYEIPKSMVEGKSSIWVKFQGINSSNTAGGVFFVRLLESTDTSNKTDEVNSKKLVTIGGNQELYISGVQENTRIEILDINGRLTKSVTIRGNENIPLNTGMYIVNINTGNEERITRKILVH